MTQPTLFADDVPVPQPSAPPVNPAPVGSPRLRPIERQQVEMRSASLDQLLTPDHSARVVWAFVATSDITPLLQSIKAVAGHVGRDANDPRVLLALWLFATLDGVGSARELDRLCREHMAYQWLCGGMSVNYHSLADFRTQQVDYLEQLLTDGVATLLHEGLVELQQVAQDGMRVRASAGAASFRRAPSLQTCLAEAERQVAALKNQLDEDDGAATRRQQAARARAAKERLERVQQALAQRQKLLELREQQKAEKGAKFEPAKLRASTTDSGIVVGVDVTNSGRDCGKLGPMLEQIQERYEELPEAMLVDGGFTTHADIETAHTAGVDVYGPIKEEEKQLAEGKNPYARKPRDGDGVAAWRERMGTDAAKVLYRLRASTAEWTNAQARNRGLYQVRVRGQRKVLAVALLYALAHNLVRAEALRQARAQAAKS